MTSDHSESPPKDEQPEPEQLRILIANQRQERLEQIAAIIRGLGHEVAGLELDIARVGELTRREQPDVAFVGLGEDSEHALDLITQIINEAACPVITVLDGQAPEFIREAAKRGVFAYVTDRDPQALQGAIEIVLRRFSEYHGLQGAFGRRAAIEQAKGILMARHAIGQQAAFDLLRERSQHDGRKLADVAQGVIDNHLILPPNQPPVPA